MPGTAVVISYFQHEAGMLTMAALGLLSDGKVPAGHFVAGFLAFDPLVCGAVLDATATEVARRVSSRRAGINDLTQLPN